MKMGEARKSQPPQGLEYQYLFASHLFAGLPLIGPCTPEVLAVAGETDE